jgi:hypothetical protein
VAGAEMDEREIEGLEAPVGHDLDELAFANEFGSHDGRKLADTGAVQKRRREAGIVVLGQKRLLLP